MRIRCEKSDLLKAVGISLRAIPVRSTMPVMQCILMRTIGGQITFTTNDMEMGIETIVPGSVEEEGVIAVDAKMFSDIVRKLPEDQVIIRTGDNFVTTITCGKAKFNIPGLDGEDFTDLPAVEKEDCVILSQLTLKNIITQTIFAASPADNNKILTGELFEISGNYLRVVALDGHRVAIRKTELNDNYASKRVIVPAKTLNEVSRILSGEAEEEVRIYMMDNHIVFEIPGTTVVSALIEGEYFDIDRMISMDYETLVRINRQTFMESLDRSALFFREGDKKPIILDIRDAFMRITIESDMGSVDEEADIEKEGRDIMIGFNPRIMMDALKAISDEEVSLYFLSAKAPCFIRNADNTYTYMVLPVNFVR